jgi:hypothetical protein
MRCGDLQVRIQLAFADVIRPALVGVVAISTVALLPQTARSDEGGVSFWLPGLFGSLAAAPVTPGWSLGSIYYHTSVGASGSVAAAKEVQIGRFPVNVNVSLNANLNAQADLLLLVPTYTFATPVLGGQAAVSMMSVFGRNSVGIDGTLTLGAAGVVLANRMGSVSDSLTAFGDLYPTATLKWNSGVHNWMTYITGDIPVGAYDPNRLANIGIGHGAVDIGGGYTYLNPATGHEFSGVGGFTYNLKNQDTQYQNGIDFHFDWGASQFLSKQVFVGVVGYAYQQLTNDSGQNPLLGGMRSRVLGVGPQLGYLFPVGKMQGYLNVKGYGEFDAANRPSGWNTWLTLSISEAPPASTVTPTKRMVTK